MKPYLNRNGIDVLHLNSAERVPRVPPEEGPRETSEEDDSLAIFASTQVLMTVSRMA